MASAIGNVQIIKPDVVERRSCLDLLAPCCINLNDDRGVCMAPCRDTTPRDYMPDSKPDRKSASGRMK
jgi:hypothetical protein